MLPRFFIPWDFGRAAPIFGRSSVWIFGSGFDRDFGRKIACNVFPSLGISTAIARHVGWKVYIVITNNAGNHATIFGENLNIPWFGFQRHVMMQLVDTSCQKAYLPHKLVPKGYLFLCNLPLKRVIEFVNGWQSFCNGTFLWLLHVPPWG